MSGLWHDFRFGLRLLRAKPTASLVAIVTLALGIGAATAVFSVVDAVLLRPLPYPDADRLTFVWSTFKSYGGEEGGSALPDYRAWRDQNRVFTSLAGFYTRDLNLAAPGGEPERVQAACITPNLLPTLGIGPKLGRGFAPDEEVFGRHAVAVLGHGLWQRRFGGDPGVIGKQVLLGGYPYTIVGVMPEGMPFFDNLPQVDLFVPLSFLAGDNMDSRNNHFVTLVGRLRPGVSVADAQADVAAIARRLEEQFPGNAGIGGLVVRANEQLSSPVRPVLLILFGAVALLLLVACANVANLLMARSVGRQREMAVRASLGATRARLFRQVLAESFLLAILAGGAGVVVAAFGLDAIASLLPADLPRHNAIGLHFRVLAFALGLSAVTVLLFGTLPALQTIRGDVQEQLKQAGTRATDGRERRRLRGLLVAGEMALALMLLVGAALLGRSFSRLSDVDGGFAEDALALRIPLTSAKYNSPEKGVAFFAELSERLRSLPGVSAVGMSTGLPLEFGAGWGKVLLLEGATPRSVDELPLVDFALADGDYFRTMGIPLRGGRSFEATESEKGPPVAMVNEALARRFFPDRDAVGRRIQMCPPKSLWPDANCPERRIVGVVGDSKKSALNLPASPQVWIPFRQHDREGWTNELTVVLRAGGAPTRVLQAARAEVRALDAEQPIAEVITGAELRHRALSLSRFSVLLLVIFAGVAAVLATIGIYGVVSYLTAQRTQEIGVRLALGATPREVTALVVRQGLAMTLVGVGVGTVAALVVAHILRSFLFGVAPSDPAAYAMVALPLVAVALLACWLPARRAAKVDPMTSLRSE